MVTRPVWLRLAGFSLGLRSTTAKTESVKFIKVPHPVHYGGPDLWVNPAFLLRVQYDLPKEDIKPSAVIPSISVLPTSARTLTVALDGNLKELSIVTVYSQDTSNGYDKWTVVRTTAKGSLHIHPSSVIALSENEVRCVQCTPTKLYFLDDKAALLSEFSTAIVAGTPQEVAEKLGIELTDS